MNKILKIWFERFQKIGRLIIKKLRIKKTKTEDECRRRNKTFTVYL